MAFGTGLTLRLRSLGATTEFCPVCRREQSFDLYEAQLYRMALCIVGDSWGKPHHELKCRTCGCLLEHEVDERPLDENGKPTELHIVRQRIEDCSAMEQARRDDTLTDGQREELIRSSFYSFARLFDEEPAQRVSPKTLLSVAIAMIVLIGAGIWLWKEMNHGWMFIAALASVAVLLIGLQWWTLSHNPRHAARKWIALSLLPLEPDEWELVRIKRELMSHRYKAGFLVQPQSMMRRIANLREQGAWTEPKPAADPGGDMYTPPAAS